VSNIFQPSGAEVINQSQAVSGGQQPLSQMAADETCTACNERMCQTSPRYPVHCSTMRIYCAHVTAWREGLQPRVGQGAAIRQNHRTPTGISVLFWQKWGRSWLNKTDHA
jgi:hypothetical protein